MKIFVVNLRKNVDRMSSMDRQLTRYGFPYERVEAVCGKCLAEDERHRDFAAIHSFLAMGRRLSDGEIGCALSHVGIYKDMIAKRIPMALVLEDDICCADDFPFVLDRAVNFLNVHKPQVVLFSAHGVPSVKDKKVVRIDGGMCTDAYLITLPAARIIHQANYPIVTVADRWSRWCRRYGLEVYRIFPTTVCQMNETFGTDVYEGFRPVTKRLWRYWRKVLRVPEVLLDWLWFCCMGR